MENATLIMPSSREFESFHNSHNAVNNLNLNNLAITTLYEIDIYLSNSGLVEKT